MALLDDFNLDADITVSELRQEDVLDERLRFHHRLRVRRRNDILGVLVEADEWRKISAYVRSLEEALDQHEGDVVRQILEERSSNGQFVTATADVIADIDREFRKAIGE